MVKPSSNASPPYEPSGQVGVVNLLHCYVPRCSVDVPHHLLDDVRHIQRLGARELVGEVGTLQREVGRVGRKGLVIGADCGCIGLRVLQLS
jgi:hypothetical protein